MNNPLPPPMLDKRFSRPGKKAYPSFTLSDCRNRTDRNKVNQYKYTINK